ncbi:MAG: hypothetical protein HY710_03315 [Candidatus Latescibacteria bacterium]|nr:hypothetical protein [Candidatus Latescibacterota bacterium]
MQSGRAHLAVLLSKIHEDEDNWVEQQEAIQALRQVALQSVEVEWLIESAGRREEPLPVRVAAIQVLGFHRPWLSLNLLHDDRVQAVPKRLAALAANPDEDRRLREAIIGALGWRYLFDLGIWGGLLSDPDAFLRREALYELLRAPHREAVEIVIRHLEAEPDDGVCAAISWGVCRHPLFFEVALPLLARPGGDVYLGVVHRACETAPRASLIALSKADVKFFDVREALLQRLISRIDQEPILHLIDLARDPDQRFAIRFLRDVDLEVAVPVLIALDRTVYQSHDDDWTVEAAKLVLHYWDRFPELREDIRDLLNDWRRGSPRVIQLAMSRDIYWKD